MNTYVLHIPHGHPNRPGAPLDGPIRALVVHNTANYNPNAGDREHALGWLRRAWERGRYLKNGKIVEGVIEKGSANAEGIGRQFYIGSTHRFVDEDSRTETIPLDEAAYAVGDRNKLPWTETLRGQTQLAHDVFRHRQNYLTLNWEMCNERPGQWERTKANTIEDMAAVIREKKLNPVFDLDAFLRTWRPGQPWPAGVVLILRHYDLTGKGCPAEFVKVPAEWERFKSGIKALT